MSKWVAALMVLIGCSNALADDFFAMTDNEPSRAGEEVERAVEFSGALSHRFHYALSQQHDQFPFRRKGKGPASIRFDVLLEARHRTPNGITLQLAGLASYDAELEDASYLELDQTYIEWGVSPSLNLKAGRQILSRGESNYFQIADRINPVDERAFGLAELRETLLPVAATRLSYYQARWGVDLIALHEFRPNQYDEPFGDFDPYIEFRALSSTIQENRPDVSLTEPDLAARLFWSRPWGDVAVFASRLHSREARPTRRAGDSLQLDYPQITVLGASANHVLGSWLLKSEYAYSDGPLYLAEHHEIEPASEPEGLSVEGRGHQLMLGGRYSGTRNLVLDVELLGSRIGSSQSPLSEDRTELKGVASLEYAMLNDDLVANISYMGWARDRASMLRLRLDYAFADEIVLFAGAVSYAASSQEAMLAPYQNNDRVFVGFTLSF